MNKESINEQAKKALAHCKIIDNSDGTIDVTGHLIVTFPLNCLPKINNLNGDFNCGYNNTIVNLIGTPKKVTGNFYCYNCESLETLEGAPIIIIGDFNCSFCNKLQSLKGAPKQVSCNFYCNSCKSITTLKNAPHNIGDNLYCTNSNSLPPNAKTDWLKKQANYKKRINIEKISTNQTESIWKHSI